MDGLRRGENVEVIEPTEPRGHVTALLANAVRRYSGQEMNGCPKRAAAGKQVPMLEHCA